MNSVGVGGARLYYERHGRGEPLLPITGFMIGVLDLYTRPEESHAALAEPFTRALGLPIGARTGASLAGLATDRIRRSAHVAVDR